MSISDRSAMNRRPRRLWARRDSGGMAILVSVMAPVLVVIGALAIDASCVSYRDMALRRALRNDGQVDASVFNATATPVLGSTRHGNPDAAPTAA